MKTIKTETSVSGKVVELIMLITHLNLEYYFIHIDGDLVHSQYENNNKLNAIFNECINEDFDLIYA
jgi:hypothetical protein